MDVSNKTRTYKKRWFIITMFCLLSLTNAFQWLEYSILNNVLIRYYNVESMAIDWTSMIYMLTYIPLIFPASWLLDKYGLRLTVLLGAAGNCLGAWIKCGSSDPSRFYVTFLGQTVSAIAQIFILGIPPRLAATWFGPQEVSTATALGVFGNQVGVAIGFLVPPIIVKNQQLSDGFGNNSNFSEIFISTTTKQLNVMFFGTAAITTSIFLLIIIFFSNKPEVPPSLAQLAAIEVSQDNNFGETLKSLFKNINFDLLLISYGINVGVFYALSTLLNPILIQFYQGEEENIGRIGLTLVLAGMIGSVVCGIWLDKTKRYKSTICVVYVLAFVGIIVYTFTINLGKIWIVYLVAAFLGFFTTGYLPLGFEYGCELTYPLAEGTSSGLLNASAQIFGIIITISVGYLVPLSALYCNLTMCGAIAVGTVITLIIKADLRRYKAELERSTHASMATLKESDSIATINYGSTMGNFSRMNKAYETDDSKSVDNHAINNGKIFTLQM